MTRRITILALLCALVAAALLPTAVAAETAIPLPDTMAAVGDSITQAASTAGSLGADAPHNSWSTGTSANVNSHYLRLLAAGAPISGQNHNRSVSGARMGGLQGQMATLADLDPDYLTVLIGGNDVCTPTEAQMTSVADFRAQFQAAMATLRAVSPGTHVYVVSIPRVMGLYELFRNNFWARFIWSFAGICQSLLANPTSTNQADVDRRARVDRRNRDFNAVLAEVCASAAAQPCLWDGAAAFNTGFTTSDVSGDYFHPSIAGQAKLAAVSWANGYTWVAAPPPNQAPSASFTSSCTGLDCTFTNTSTDADGTMTHAWTFGDATGSTAVSPTHPYTAGGPYTVTLTVTDDDLAADSATESLTLTAPPANQPPSASFTSSCTGLACTFTNTSTDADGTMTHAWTFGDGTGSTAVSPSKTYTADGTYTVGLTVTDDGGAVAATSQPVTVAAQTMRITSLAGTNSIVNNKNWRATVTITVRDGAGAAVSNALVSGSWTVGAPDTCTTSSAGTCLVTSDNLNRRNLPSVEFTVTDVTRAGYTYTPLANLFTSLVIQRPQ